MQRAAIWTVAIELPLAVFALLSTMPALYRTVPLVLTAHLPGILLLDGLNLCCGIGGGRVISEVGPSFEPPVLLSITILALANAAVLLLVVWLALWMHARLRTTTAASPS